jgi:hypothetical protein
MANRYSGLFSAAVVGVAAAALFLARPAADAQAPKPANHGPCVGMAAVPLGNAGGFHFRVYRAFQDGTVQVTDDPCKTFGEQLANRWDTISP